MTAVRLEWQVADGSSTAHIMVVGEKGTRRSGPRAACGRYPMRGGRDSWFGLDVDDPGFPRAAASYRVTTCEDCRITRT